MSKLYSFVKAGGCPLNSVLSFLLGTQISYHRLPYNLIWLNSKQWMEITYANSIKLPIPGSPYSYPHSAGLNGNAQHGSPPTFQRLNRVSIILGHWITSSRAYYPSLHLVPSPANLKPSWLLWAKNKYLLY